MLLVIKQPFKVGIKEGLDVFFNGPVLLNAHGQIGPKTIL